MSAHPVKSLACAILEHGNFKPSFWSPKEENDAPVKRKDDTPETSDRPLKKTKVKENVKSDYNAYAPVKKKKVKQNVKEDVETYAPVKTWNKKSKISDYFGKETNTNHNPKNVIVIDDEDRSWKSNVPPRKSVKREREASTEPVVKDSKLEKGDSKEEFKMFFSSK